MPASEQLLSSVALVPPWFVLAALLGAINGAAAFTLLGQRLVRLPAYVVLGVLAAGVGQVLAMALRAPAPVQIGEVNLAVASATAWAVLAAARVTAKL